LPIGLLSQDIVNSIIIGFVLLFVLVCLSNYIFTKSETTYRNIGISAFIILYIVFLLSFILKTFYISFDNRDIGQHIIWFIIFGSAITDMFAHIIGSNFGKYKLCLNISPKKSVEGAIGGLLGGIISFVLYSMVLNNYFDFQLNYLIMGTMGLVIAILGQLGDLVASGIKRKTQIKDFGNFMPRAWWDIR